MAKIVSIKKDSSGIISYYGLDDGRIISREEGIRMAKEGKIEGVMAGVAEYGEKTLWKMPEGSGLDDLPELK